MSATLCRGDPARLLRKSAGVCSGVVRLGLCRAGRMLLRVTWAAWGPLTMALRALSIDGVRCPGGR